MTAKMHQGRIAGTRWDPTLYHRFSDHRLRPALELLERVPHPSPTVVYDLGCGSGEVTQIMAERWPEAAIYGLDNSQEMLARAGAISGRVHWIESDIQTWSPSHGADLIYSNATLQWLDRHDELFPRLLSHLKPGGCLAVQMPLSWGMPSHRLMRETLANGGPGGGSLGTEELRVGVGRKWVDDAEEYYDLLENRTESLDIWETTYMQVLNGDDPVLTWVSGTGLRPITKALKDGERTLFLAEYARRLREAYPQRPNGSTIYPFRRLFLVATV